MAAVHPRGAGTPRTAGELWQDPLESHEVSGGGECGEIHLQIYSTPDWTLMSRRVRRSRRWGSDKYNKCSDKCLTTVQKFVSWRTSTYFGAGVPLGPVEGWYHGYSRVVSSPSSGNPVLQFLKFAVVSSLVVLPVLPVIFLHVIEMPPAITALCRSIL